MTTTIEPHPEGITEGERQPESVKPVDALDNGVNARRTLHAGTRDLESTNPVTLGEFTRGWVASVRAEFTPPNVWRTGRPSLRSGWLYARYGRQAPEHGASRQACRAGVAIGLPVRALALWLDWAAERPSRLIAAFVLYVVVAQFLPVAPDWLSF